MLLTKTFVAGIAVAMLATAGGAAAGASAADTGRADDCGPVQTGVVFNQPHDDDGDDDKIHRHIVCLIEGVPGGAEIRLATYHFAHRNIRDALIEAHGRGVKVKILTDRGVSGDAHDRPFYDRMRSELGTNKQEDSWIALCPGTGTGDDDDRACIGNAKMHNKFLLFSETHGVPNVTFLTSSNLEDDYAVNGEGNNSGTNMWNSGYTAANDLPLHDHFDKYFDVLSADAPTDPDYYDTNPPEPIGNYKVYHSPRRNGNTALDILDEVECHGNSSGGTNPGNRTIVRVAMWAITGAKGSDPGSRIAQRLWELDNEGCYVDIVADEISDGESGPLRALLQKPGSYHGPEVREFNGDRPHGLHEKNLLIDGHFGGKPDQKVVFTGSYNFTSRSVARNDETWLRINDASIHDRFRDNFLEVRNAAHTCWQTSKPEGCDGGRAVDTDPPAPLNCHETADKYQGSGNLYLYSTNYCAGPNDAKDNSGADRDYGDGEGQIKNYDNKANSIVNTTSKTIKFYNYPNYNAGHPEGDTFCLRPGHWVNRTALYGDDEGSWQNSISSHRLVDDPNLCDRWFGGYHEPNR
jgi:phospholipase D-like protein